MNVCPIDKKPCDCPAPCGLLDYFRVTGASGVSVADAAALVGRLRPSTVLPKAATCGPSAVPPPSPPATAAVPGTSCCAIRRKVVVGVLAILPEADCGVSDAELVDFMRFDVRSPGGPPVLAVRHCPWCGALRTPGTEERVTPAPFAPGGDA